MNVKEGVNAPSPIVEPQKSKAMFNFRVSITITDESNQQVATFDLPKVESGETLSKVLTLGENLLRPFMPSITTAEPEK